MVSKIKKNIIKKFFKYYFSILCVCSCLAPNLIISQQIPLHNQYIYNPLIINPSFAGVSAISSVNLTSRSQWIGFADGINTISFSGNYALSEVHGVGGTLFQDNTGAMRVTGLELDYSFKFPLIADYSLSLGLGLVPYQYFYDANQIYNSDDETFIINIQSDPALISSEKKTNLDANFGLFVYSDFLYAGFSVLNLLQSSTLTNVGEGVPNQLVRHVYALIGYNYFNTSSKIGLEQTILMRNSSYTGAQFDFNIKASFNELFWLSCGYRTNKEILAGFGVKYGRFGFMYSIDINHGSIGELSNSSHEFGLVFYLNNNKFFNWGNDLNLQY